MKHKKLWIIPLGISGVFLIAYFSFTYYFSNHYFWGTVINGKDCSCMTVQETDEMFQESLRQYELTVYARDGLEEIISGDDISMEYQVRDELSQIQSGQNAFLWFTAFFCNLDYAVSDQVLYDEEEIKEFVEALPIFIPENMREPVSARISEYLPEEKGYRIIEEEKGSYLVQGAEDQVVEAVLCMQDQIDLDESGLYLNPRTDSDSVKLNRLVEQLNHYTKTTIIYEFGEDQVVLDGDTIHEWISVRGNFVYLDKKAVRDYVEKLAEEHDTYYQQKEFVTTNGEEKTLRSCYGWLIDVDAETEALLADLENGGTDQREPVYSRRGEDFSENNIADSYVEIDLGQQHLYLYIEGKLVLETDIVSGCLANGDGTPAGIYDLEYRTRNVVLRGPTWESYVNYWMPFNGSVGMHDATWRNAFGGDIYLNSGSHGCINLPYQAAEIIYQYVYSGIPVICYY